jgi:hypothetical protein
MISSSSSRALLLNALRGYAILTMAPAAGYYLKGVNVFHCACGVVDDVFYENKMVLADVN